MLCYVVLLRNKKLLVSDKEKGGTITVGDFINGATKGIGLILYYVKKVICFTFFTFDFSDVKPALGYWVLCQQLYHKILCSNTGGLKNVILTSPLTSSKTRGKPGLS